MIETQLIKTYSEIHSKVDYNNNHNISFDGSQRQFEIFNAWNRIENFYEKTKLKKITFLEVGAWKGLWGLAFHEFCKLKNIKGEYVTITKVDLDPNNQPLYKTIEYLNNNGTKASLVDLNTLDENAIPRITEILPNFNIVFIDAGHKYEEVVNDINKFSPLTKDILLFHDIRPKINTGDCGVYQAIQDLGITLDEEICSVEHEMGIGIKYI